MKKKLLRYILKKLGNANHSGFKECYECAVKTGSPTLCNQCLWVREEISNKEKWENVKRLSQKEYTIEDFITK